MAQSKEFIVQITHNKNAAGYFPILDNLFEF